MKIGFAADTYKPYISGVTNYIYLHKAELERMGHEVYLFTFGQGPVQVEEARVIYSPGYKLKVGYAFGFRYSQPALAQLRQMDIVHLHHPFITGQLVLRECKPRAIPLVFTGHTRYDEFFHDYVPWLPLGMGISMLKMYLPGFCRKMDRVISNSAASTEGMRKCGVDVELCRIPNGVDLDPFLRISRDWDLRKRLVGDSRMVFLFVGRLAPEKNLPLLFQAFQGLCKKYPSASLVMVGTGPSEAALRAQIASSEIASRVVFTGLIPYQDLPAYFSIGDAFVMPSLHDSHPLAVLEAMAAGLPLLVLASPAYEDTVVDGGNGLISQNSAVSFQEVMERALEDEALRCGMGKRSREMSFHFSVQKTAARLVGLYEEILAERHRR